MLLNHMVNFDHILHTYAQHPLTTGIRNHFIDGQGLTEHQSSLLFNNGSITLILINALS